MRQSEGESRGKILEGSTPGTSSMCSEGALGSSSSIFEDINVFYKRGGRFYVSNEARVRRRAAFFFSHFRNVHRPLFLFPPFTCTHSKTAFTQFLLALT